MKENQIQNKKMKSNNEEWTCNTKNDSVREINNQHKEMKNGKLIPKKKVI